MQKIIKTNAEWKAMLTPESYKVTREHGTERAGTSPLNFEKRAGIFNCICCDEPLFNMNAKYESGTGWPSFYEPFTPASVTEHDDSSWFSRRTEIKCATCDAHLGHVFNDGPKPTGLRYCMNGVAMKFKAE